MKTQLLAVTLAGVLSQAAYADDAPALETDADKVSYGLGMMIGERVLNQYGDIDYDLLLQGIKAQEAGETLLTIEEAQVVLQAQQTQASEAKAAEAGEVGKTYLAENAAREGVTVTDSGLQYETLQEGDGAKPTLEDTVTVHYVGTLLDGSEFDSSIARGEPASFPLKGVIPGWTEGLQLMSVGSKYRFVIPADLAYGERGAGQSIGPGETLVFEVELLEIKQ
jgi:FKBP-type peptidyl-prolyl cis-trans isomerase